jgi:hypothetical protein
MPEVLYHKLSLSASSTKPWRRDLHVLLQLQYILLDLDLASLLAGVWSYTVVEKTSLLLRSQRYFGSVSGHIPW